MLEEIKDTEVESKNFVLDFSAVIEKNGNIYSKDLPSGKFMFVPNGVGGPFVISPKLQHFLDAFDGVSSVGSLVGKFQRENGHNIDELVQAIEILESSGALQPAYLKNNWTRKKPLGATKDINVWLHLTDTCNLGCTYCFLGDKSQGDMSDEVLDLVVAEIIKVAHEHHLEQVTIRFAGGEPTLALDKISRFKSTLEKNLQGIKTHCAILTNGTILNTAVTDFLSQGRSSISISLDGLGDTHDAHRKFKSTGEGSFIAVQENVNKLISAGYPPYIMTTVTPENAHGLPDLIEWVVRNNLRCRISVARRTKTCDWSPSDFNKKLIDTFESAFSRISQCANDEYDPLDHFDICELRFKNPGKWFCCGIGTNQVVIKPDGSVVACPMKIQESGLFFEQGKLLDASQATVGYAIGEEKGKCQDCQWFNVCLGGCPVANEWTKGHAFGPSEFCSFYKFVIPRFIDLVGEFILRKGDKK